VYIDPQNVDDELVESIRYPAEHPNAAEVGPATLGGTQATRRVRVGLLSCVCKVFYRVVSRTSGGKLATINQLLGVMSVPLLLLWGDSVSGAAPLPRRFCLPPH
jgi:hypothetical protein